MPDTLRELVAEYVREYGDCVGTTSDSLQVADAILDMLAEKRAESSESREAKLRAECADWREKAQRWALKVEEEEARCAKLVEALRLARPYVEYHKAATTVIAIVDAALATVKEGK